MHVRRVNLDTGWILHDLHTSPREGPLNLTPRFYWSKPRGTGPRNSPSVERLSASWTAHMRAVQPA